MTDYIDQEIMSQIVCNICSEIYDNHLSNLGIDIQEDLCKSCFETKLRPNKICAKKPRSLCKDIYCSECYYKSFACAHTVNFVDYNEATNLKLPKARYITKGSGKLYPFLGECGHKFMSTLHRVNGANNSWCNNHECIEKKKMETCSRNFGVPWSQQSQEVREKGKQTCLARYGEEYPTRSQEVKDRRKQTCYIKYGTEHSSQSQEVKDKVKQTCLTKYGVSSPFEADEIKKKIEQTNLSKYGSENPFGSEEIKDKIKGTNLSKYGVENPSQSQDIKNKKIRTSIINYGVPYASQSSEFRDQVRKTCLEKYGVDNPMKDPEIFHKALSSLYSHKDYTFPSGRKTQVQGYEPIAIDILLKIYKEEDIQTWNDNKMAISYNFQGKEHVYYPDLFIVPENLIIEVKSNYTYSADEEKNLAKADACLGAGYNFKFIILDKDYNLVDHKFGFTLPAKIQSLKE